MATYLDPLTIAVLFSACAIDSAKDGWRKLAVFFGFCAVLNFIRFGMVLAGGIS